MEGQSGAGSVGCLHIVDLLFARFSTVIGVAGDGYCIVAGDTRMSRGYSIMSRDVTKLVKL